MDNNYTQEFTATLNEAMREATRHNCSVVTPEFVLLGMRNTQDAGYRLLENVGGRETVRTILDNLDASLFNLDTPQGHSLTSAPITDRIVKLSILEARIQHSSEVTPEHLLLAIFRNNEIRSMEFMKPFSNASISY